MSRLTLACSRIRMRPCEEVTYALGQRRPDPAEVIDALIEALSDPSAIVRVGAAGALGEIGAPADLALRLRS